MTPILIEMLKKATKGSPMLDWAIAEALGEVPPHSIRTVGCDYEWYRQPGEWSLSKALDSEGRSMTYWSPCPRTTSIDAALTLVPSAHEWRCGNDGENNNGWAAVGNDVWDECNTEIASTAATPALALCIAALRARKESPND